MNKALISLKNCSRRRYKNKFDDNKKQNTLADYPSLNNPDLSTKDDSQ